ncbi:putative protein OS=Streptomyces microflavus OX=1919 GN=Smic_06640 PE=4 SV=1 [Streptomyces microflavus]|uniref:Uncharacterized protein n=1 Tax=Streptomyces microflavus TaxID=1919 RepID=A0A7J0CIK2_STRMI|nr:hypothetical protein Smic_06640 [Streptomyces microflavus]
MIVVYVLSVWHTLLYGTNVWYDGWFRTSVWLLQLPIAALLLLRLLRPARRSEKLPLSPGATASRTGWALRLGGRLAVVGVMVALVVVVVSGNDGGRTVPPDDTASTHNHD